MEWHRNCTTTSADGKQVTILRDSKGGGWTDQKETRATTADDSRVVTITNLNQDGTKINQVATTYSVDGLSKTVAAANDNCKYSVRKAA